MPEDEKIVVGFDGGHGGSDRKNRGPTGYVEADGNLEMTKILAMMLEGTGAFKVVLTRDTDTSVELRKRANILADAGCDMAISIHSNASAAGKARGTECFYSVDLPQDKAFAAILANRISTRFGVPNRGAKMNGADPKRPGKSGATKTNAEDYFAFVDQAQDRGIPHVFLLETLFHDNPQDEAILKKLENKKLIMQEVFEAICIYYGVESTTTVRRDLKALNNALKQRNAQLLDEEFWQEHAVKGKMVDGGLVAAFIDRMTKLL